MLIDDVSWQKNSQQTKESLLGVTLSVLIMDVTPMCIPTQFVTRGTRRVQPAVECRSLGPQLITARVTGMVEIVRLKSNTSHILRPG